MTWPPLLMAKWAKYTGGVVCPPSSVVCLNFPPEVGPMACLAEPGQTGLTTWGGGRYVSNQNFRKKRCNRCGLNVHAGVVFAAVAVRSPSQVFQLVSEFTPRAERLGLDEVYLDQTSFHLPLCNLVTIFVIQPC